MLHSPVPGARRHRVAALMASVVVALTALPATVAAHDDAPTLTSLTPTEQSNQFALQSALEGNTPDDAEHASEHQQVDAAEATFRNLSAARRRAIRAGARQAAASSAAESQASQARAFTTGADGAAGSAATVGAWTTAPFQAPSYAINMVMLPTGKVLVFSMGSSNADCGAKCAPGDLGNGGFNTNNDGTAAVWDPTKGYGASAFKILPPPNVNLEGYDLTDIRADPTVAAGNRNNPKLDQGVDQLRPAPIFCTGQVQTADGRVLVAGGNLEARGNAYGLRMNFLFDPFTEQWTREPDLQHARWYPTLTRLPSGRVAILGGRNEHGKDVASIELYPEQGTPVPGVGGAAAGTTGLRTSSLYDDADDPANPLGYKNGGAYSDGLGYYPFTMVLPSGDLSISRWATGRLGILGGDNTFRYLNGTGYKSALGKYATAFPAPGDENGTSEMVMAGGLAIDPATYGPTTTLQDSVWSIKPGDAAANPAVDWTAQPPLNVARRNAVTTLLPDGSAVIVAGGDANDRVPLAQIQNPDSRPQRQIELWDPTTRQWTLGPAEATPRGYHSTSVLLPDGRVLSGGDDWVSYVLDADHTDAMDSTFEIYSPPYLFKETADERPVLSGLPARAEYGSQIAVTGQAGPGHTITAATLVAPGSVTHAFDSNQRVLRLPITAGADGNYSVTAPTSGNAAPPGDYMLFLLDEQGVPSIGKFIRIAADHAEAEASGTDPTPTDPGTPDLPATTPVVVAPAPTPATPATPATPSAPPATATATPAPASPTATPKPTTVKATPAVALDGKRVRISLALTPTGKRCPTRVSATTTVSGRKTTARLRLKAKTVSGKRRCVATGTLALRKAPSARTKVIVRFSGTGVRATKVTATRV